LLNSKVLVSEYEKGVSTKILKSKNLDHHSNGNNPSVKFNIPNEKKSAGLNDRFKLSGKSSMQMDGVSNGAMTPAAFAAASGIGGVGALLSPEDDELMKANSTLIGNGMSDTYISSNSLKAALCAAGTACRAVDIVLTSENTNVFACVRPPGHHAGRYGCTTGCLSTGFCILNNAAMATVYARVRWGIERVAVVDIDVHFGNGTAELLRNDPGAFFASVHMIYGQGNDGIESFEDAARIKKSAKFGFYPSLMGQTEITDNYVSVGVYPSIHKTKKMTKNNSSGDVSSDDSSVASSDENENNNNEENIDDRDNNINHDLQKMITETQNGDYNEINNTDLKMSYEKKNEFVGADGYLRALKDIIIPQMEKFKPQLLIISGFFF
jgi:hypothetical protein